MPSLDGRLPCDECGKIYGNVSHLNRHKRMHTGERPYKCAVCSKSFMRKDHLDDHHFSHSPERPFPCTRCAKRFYTKQKLNRHTALHDKPKKYACADCTESFVKKNQLSRHRVLHTGKLPFECPEPGCQQTFPMPSALRKHQERRHSLSTFLCIESGCNAEPFAKFSELQRHLKIHRPTHSHACDSCGKRFRSAASLNKHKPIHEFLVSDRQTHKCRFPGCTAAYTSSGNLGTHVRSCHLNRKAFVCEHCNARFSVKSSHERHLRKLHSEDAKTDDGKYSCRVCHSSSATRAALRRHLRVEHSMPAHVCEGEDSNVGTAVDSNSFVKGDRKAEDVERMPILTEVRRHDTEECNRGGPTKEPLGVCKRAGDEVLPTAKRRKKIARDDSDENLESAQVLGPKADTSEGSCGHPVSGKRRKDEESYPSESLSSTDCGADKASSHLVKPKGLRTLTTKEAVSNRIPRSPSSHTDTEPSARFLTISA